MTDPDVAVIVTDPTPVVVASPPTDMLAAPVPLVRLQVTVLVTSAVEASLYVAVAVNCCVSPSAKLALPGVTAMETNDAVAIESVVVPETLPRVAEMFAEPTATVLARPPPLTVTSERSSLAHVTNDVRFDVVLSV